MTEFYIVNRLDSQRASPIGFQAKKDAKVVRDTLTKEGIVCVVSRGPDHPLGPSRVQSHCLNTERISRKRKRLRKIALSDQS